MRSALLFFISVLLAVSCECQRPLPKSPEASALEESLGLPADNVWKGNPKKSHSVSGGQGDSWKSRMGTEEYNKSLEREMYLKKAGMKDAAKIERNARNQYLRNGGYDSKDGGKQVHYNGSKQQENDLKAIDEYMKTHPDF